MGNVFENKIPVSWKRKIFDQCELPFLTYGAETSALTKTATKLRIVQKQMKKSVLGVSLKDRNRNEKE